MYVYIYIYVLSNFQTEKKNKIPFTPRYAFAKSSDPIVKQVFFFNQPAASGKRKKKKIFILVQTKKRKIHEQRSRGKRKRGKIHTHFPTKGEGSSKNLPRLDALQHFSFSSFSFKYMQKVTQHYIRIFFHHFISFFFFFLTSRVLFARALETQKFNQPIYMLRAYKFYIYCATNPHPHLAPRSQTLHSLRRDQSLCLSHSQSLTLEIIVECMYLCRRKLICV